MKNYRLLFVVLFPIFAFSQSLQLLYFTDAHQLYPLDDVEGTRGGVARLKTIVDQAKEDYPATITIHGGDFVGGVLYGGIYHGKHMIPAFNLIPVDYYNFGQHEFDYGLDHLQSLLKESKGQFFTSNLIHGLNQPLFDLPTHVLINKNGLRILMIGLTDQMETTKKDPRVLQEDVYTSTARVLNQIDLKLVDFIVAVTQMDLEKNKKLLQYFPSIDLILTEELEEYHTQIHYQNHRPIIATAGNMSSVAKVILSKQKRPLIEIIPLDYSIPRNPELQAIENQERQRVELLLHEKLGTLHVDLDAFESLKKESRAGNLITDAMRDYYQTDLALIDGSGIRKSVEKGDFTYEKARTLLPYGNKMVVVKIKGVDFKNFIYGYLTAEKPKLVQLSGSKYIWEPKTKELVMEGINPDKIYTLVLNDYNFSKLNQYESIVVSADHNQSISDYEALKHYIIKHQIINPPYENRIIIKNE
ncbi:MAG TPA: 5'-nucleotidase C-terminal domain-containing protein [Faecalibacter sp.]